MELKNFNELINKLQNELSKKKVAVAAAQDEHTLEAVFRAKKEGIIEPVLIGNKEIIKKILNKLEIEFNDLEIICTENDVESAEKAVELVNENKADFIMKGKLQTADLLKAVVNKAKGLGTGRIMSTVGIMELPGYHKLLCMTDGGMVMYPTLEEKKQILENVIEVFKAFGYEKPKIAVLAAVETVNAKMPETVDANILKNMSISGEIKDCIIEGPISYDLAMSKESAQIKGYDSPVTEDADILLVPNITVGNILSKALIYSAGAKSAGMVVGAKVPVVVTSRGSTTEEKYLSIVLCAGAANNK
ncbi:MAG: bifunctional enoyl-CoA hydratase/phosphate acetyltransferase [Sedimentibacter sp.]